MSIFRSTMAGRMLVAGLAMLSLSTASYASNEEIVSADAVDAIWRAQSFDFAYRGYTTAYSCSSLRERVHTILQTLGARDTLQIRTWDCDDPSYSARVHITVSTPVEATPENVRAL